MKDLDFQDYTARVTDADGDEHESNVRAAVVDESTARVKNDQGNPVAREVMTPTGPRPVAVGDVVVETDRPGVYDYMTGAQWEDAGYGSTEDNASQWAVEDASADEESELADTEPDVNPQPENGTTLRKLSGNDNS